MKHLLTIIALLALASHADAGRRDNVVSAYETGKPPRHGFNVITGGGGNDVIYQVPQWRGWGGSKRGRGGDPVPCCAEDPGQTPRK